MYSYKCVTRQMFSNRLIYKPTCLISQLAERCLHVQAQAHRPLFLHVDSVLVLFFATQCSSLQKINEIQFHLLANLQLLHVLHVSGAIDRQLKRTLTLILLQTAKPAALIQHKGRGYLHPQTVSEMIHGGYMNSLNVINATTRRQSGKIKRRDQYCLY